MNNTRIISRLDIKGENLIKTVRFEGLRKVGRPADAATKYYNDGIDELILMDMGMHLVLLKDRLLQPL